MVGYVGVLTIASRGAGGPGEVKLRIRGGTEHFLAVFDDPLPVGTHVLLIEDRGNRTFTVIPWDESMRARPIE